MIPKRKVLRYLLNGQEPDIHPVVEMGRLGLSYYKAEFYPVADCWFFYVEQWPQAELPDFIDKVELHEMIEVGDSIWHVYGGTPHEFTICGIGKTFYSCVDAAYYGKEPLSRLERFRIRKADAFWTFDELRHHYKSLYREKLVELKKISKIIDYQPRKDGAR